jgi:hypothetical protein
MKDLTQGSVTRHLLHVSAFSAVSMVVQTLYLLADLPAVHIARTPGFEIKQVWYLSVIVL